MASEKDDLLAEAREAFDCAQDFENENRTEALDDVRFARLGEQWPSRVVETRGKDRPMLTINKLPAFIRQVVNDARQNKPSIKVHPVDSGADPETAEIMNGLIRNIETTSNADVAYDTATEHAVTSGWGYIKVGLDYAHDDTFDMDLAIERVSNPFSIYGDPHSEAADSSDWNTAFEIDWLTHKDFEAQYKDAGKVDWDSYGQGIAKPDHWMSDDSVMVARWWRREEMTRRIVQLTDGQILDAEGYKKAKDLFDVQGLTVKAERDTKSWKVKRICLTGAEVLAEEPWPGIYIPIIPVYGDEVNVEGKRYFRSLIRDAKDPQRMFNYWRTTATELVALQPRVPFIGPKGAFKTDAAKWRTINTANHQYVEYDGPQPPQRQPMDMGAAAGALQEAMNATDDMKGVMGLYDASLGARSNETSGKAIMARQREGDVSTFHFQDNMSRAIRHAGRILIDLIPKVYNDERIIRVLGEDGKPSNVPLKQPVPVTDDQGQPVMEQGPPDMMTGQPTQQPKTRIYDLAAGKYDLTVKAGPSFTSRREEAADQMMQFIQALPQSAPVIGDLLAANLDWPQADEIGERLKSLLPPQATGGLPPELEQQMQQMQQQMQQLTQENQALKQGAALKDKELQIKDMEVKIKAAELKLKGFEAETDRMQAMKPEPQQQPDPIDGYRAETERYQAMKPEPQPQQF
jgi:hypothetical protein